MQMIKCFKILFLVQFIQQFIQYLLGVNTHVMVTAVTSLLRVYRSGWGKFGQVHGRNIITGCPESKYTK